MALYINKCLWQNAMGNRVVPRITARPFLGRAFSLFAEQRSGRNNIRIIRRRNDERETAGNS